MSKKISLSPHTALTQWCIISILMALFLPLANASSAAEKVRISGIVKNGPLPAAGSTVRLICYDEKGSSHEAITRTNKNGYYQVSSSDSESFRNCRPGNIVHITADHQGKKGETYRSASADTRADIDCVDPKPTLTPTPTKKPSPSKSPTLTPTPTPTKKPSPTISAAPTISPKPSKTPKPPKTPTSSPTPTPALSPSPTVTLTPTVSLQPSPSLTPTPTNTPTPTDEPTPTPTPEEPPVIPEFGVVQAALALFGSLAAYTSLRRKTS